MKSTTSGSLNVQVISEAQDEILFLYIGEGNQNIKYFQKGNTAAKGTYIRYYIINACFKNIMSSRLAPRKRKQEHLSSHLAPRKNKQTSKHETPNYH